MYVKKQFNAYEIFKRNIQSQEKVWKLFKNNTRFQEEKWKIKSLCFTERP